MSQMALFLPYLCVHILTACLTHVKIFFFIQAAAFFHCCRLSLLLWGFPLSNAENSKKSVSLILFPLTLCS